MKHFKKCIYFQNISTTEVFLILPAISIDFCSGFLVFSCTQWFFECEIMFSGILSMEILCNLDEIALLRRGICSCREPGLTINLWAFQNKFLACGLFWPPFLCTGLPLVYLLSQILCFISCSSHLLLLQSKKFSKGNQQSISMLFSKWLVSFRCFQDHPLFWLR